MKFDPSKTLTENLAVFRSEAEKIDKECADIFFANLSLLFDENRTKNDREAVAEFNSAVLTALNDLPTEGEKK